MTTDFSGSLKEGIPIFSVPKGADFKHDMQMTIAVAFNDIESVKGQPVLSVLQQGIDLVERVILIFENRFFIDQHQ